jgi:hypothetical protein
LLNTIQLGDNDDIDPDSLAYITAILDGDSVDPATRRMQIAAASLALGGD